jgi:hypothetical protein
MGHIGIMLLACRDVGYAIVVPTMTIGKIIADAGAPQAHRDV